MAYPPGGPYLLPNGTLRNKLGTIDHERLSVVERDIVAGREWVVRENLPRPPFTFGALRGIQKRPFCEVYDWAGEPRTIGLGKMDCEGPGGRTSNFPPPSEINEAARDIFADLKGAGYLRGLSRAGFAADGASLFVRPDNPHRAREGNGRTERLMLKAVAGNAGHPLAFDVVTRERMISASAAGSRGDGGSLVHLFHAGGSRARHALGMNHPTKADRHAACRSPPRTTGMIRTRSKHGR